VEEDGAADGPAVGGIAVEAFDDEHAARLESFLQRGGHFAAARITDENQIPAAFAEVELFFTLDFGLEPHAELLRRLLRKRDGLVCRIEAGDVPSLLRQPDGVAALAHSHLERR